MSIPITVPSFTVDLTNDVVGIRLAVVLRAPNTYYE